MGARRERAPIAEIVRPARIVLLATSTVTPTLDGAAASVSLAGGSAVVCVVSNSTVPTATRRARIVPTIKYARACIVTPPPHRRPSAHSGARLITHGRAAVCLYI